MQIVVTDEDAACAFAGPETGRDHGVPAKSWGGNASKACTHGCGVSRGRGPGQFVGRDHRARPAIAGAGAGATPGWTTGPSVSSTDDGIVRQRWLAA